MNESMALPWGVPCRRSTEESSTSLGLPIELNAGQRIQVLWHLTDDAGSVAAKWWGAELLNRPCKDDAQQWSIRYDQSHGFESEEATIRFISAETLERLEDCAQEERIMQWRKEGTSSIDDEDEEVGKDQDQIINIQDLREEQDQMERETGQSLDQAALEHLQSNMEHDQQLKVLAGFRTFADHFVSQLQELMQEKDNADEYVITANDVQNIVAGLKR